MKGVARPSRTVAQRASAFLLVPFAPHLAVPPVPLVSRSTMSAFFMTE